MTTYVQDAPPELARIVTKTLQKDREERYQDARDLAVDLKSVKRLLDVNAHLSRHSGEQAGSSGALTARGMTKRAILGAATVAAMALAYAGYSGFLAKGVAKSIDSVAVLPFANESGVPDNEYLSDGISETLINSLSQLSDVKVIARSSSFVYKGKPVDVQEAARALDVEAIVTGRVTQRGDMLLIGVELVDTADRRQLWGEQYSRKAEDLLQVQAEISRDVAENLRRRLSSGERNRVAKPETLSEEAYELALKARFAARRGGVQDRKRAIGYFQQAVALDSNYALAYVGLSSTYRALVADSAIDPKEFTPKAEAAVRRALAIDETLADAHGALGNLLRDSWDWTGAEREYRRAIALNPSLVTARRGYAWYLSLAGRHDEAIAEMTEPASSIR